MRLRYVVSVGFLLVASGCQDRNGLDFMPGQDGGAAGQGGTGTGGNATGGNVGSGGVVGSGGIVGTGGVTGKGGATGRGGAGGSVCTGPVCDIYCQYGNATDENGCPLCKCNPPPVCPGIACANRCEFGYAKDMQGCTTCTCNPPPMCKPMPCQYCPNGYVKDDAGCSTCKCIEGCPAVACPPIACPYGFEIDKNGCNTCQCRGKPICEPVACDLYCPNGFATDGNGCPTCKCKPTMCPGVACRLYCPNGFATGPDGCQICACNPSGPCQPSECPPPPPLPVRMCADGSTTGAVCERNKTGMCGWSVTACPPECGAIRDPYSCAGVPSCQWLEPGCSEPSIPVAGCYARSLVNCGDGTRMCPAGKQCQKRTFNPCAPPNYGNDTPGSVGGSTGGGAAPMDPVAKPGVPVAPPQCTACAAGITICL